MKILLVEDEPVSRLALTKILTALPEHQTTVAENGAIAWDLLDDPSRSFDVVFLDLELPKIDGFELLQRIRQAPLLRSLEVVVCTTSNDRPTVVKAAQHGARHYIIKPCATEVVLGKLRQLQPVGTASRGPWRAGS